MSVPSPHSAGGSTQSVLLQKSKTCQSWNKFDIKKPKSRLRDNHGGIYLDHALLVRSRGNFGF